MDIDKVASAIFHAIERDHPFSEVSDCVRANFHRQAQAAINAGLPELVAEMDRLRRKADQLEAARTEIDNN